MAKPITTEQFVLRSKDIHGNKYDYSLVEYYNMRTKVQITCPNHGKFEQTPVNHVSGSGCNQCGIEKNQLHQTSNTEKFTTKAKSLYGQQYDYSLVNYINNRIKVQIICKEHGMFEQRPMTHLTGDGGCKKCKSNKMSNALKQTKEEFISKANIIHNNQYDYSNTTYVSSQHNVVIKCKIHGVFEQTPNNHVSNKTGCPTCSLMNNPGRYSEETFSSSPELRKTPAHLYFVKFSNNKETFFKVGITVNPVNKRFCNKEYSKYNVKIIDDIIMPLHEAFQKEQRILLENKICAYTPKQKFGGWTECFSEDISKLF
jgi:hypothetical protein